MIGEPPDQMRRFIAVFLRRNRGMWCMVYASLAAKQTPEVFVAIFCSYMYLRPSRHMCRKHGSSSAMMMVRTQEHSIKGI